MKKSLKIIKTVQRRTKVNKGIVAVGGVIVLVFGIIAVIMGMSAMGTYNDWIAKEKGIQAQYSENQNSYDDMFKTVMETAQVPKEYTKQVKEAFATSISARYGEKGSQAVFQMLTEVNPNIDPKMYEELQQTIKSYRTRFKADQTTLLDKKRVYVTELEQFPGVIYAWAMRFPRIDLAKYDIVTSEETTQAFETKKAAPLNVFGN